MTAAVVFSFSRGALLGLAAAGAYAAIVHWRQLPVILAVVGVGVVVVIGVYKRDPGRFDTSYRGQGQHRADEHRIAAGHVGGCPRAHRRAPAPRRRPGKLQGPLLRRSPTGRPAPRSSSRFTTPTSTSPRRPASSAPRPSSSTWSRSSAVRGRRLHGRLGAPGLGFASRRRWSARSSPPSSSRCSTRRRSGYSARSRSR